MGHTVDMGRVTALESRFAALGDRLALAEKTISRHNPLLGIDLRFTSIDTRLKALEHRLGIHPDPPTAAVPPVPSGESPVYQKLHADLVQRGIQNFRFVRVPGPYYEKPLEFRAQKVSAASTDHLCKTMVMENTKVITHDESEPRLAKFFMVLVQYTATIDAEKLKRFVHKIANEVAPLSKSRINMRMVADDAAQKLTGYGHNAVTPVCSAARLPIIMSHRIAELQGLFFLGAGEVDLKVGMPAAEFVKGFGNWPVYVVDCTA